MEKLFRFIYIIYFLLLGSLGGLFAKFNIIGGSIPLLPTELLIGVWLLNIIRKKNNFPFLNFVYFVFGFYVLIQLLFSKIDLYSIRLFMPFVYIVLAFITYDYINCSKDIKRIFVIGNIAVLCAFFLSSLNYMFFGYSDASETSTIGVYYLYIGSFGVFFFIFNKSFYLLLEESGRKYINIAYIGVTLAWVLFFALHRSAILSITLPLIVFIKWQHWFKNLHKLIILLILGTLIILVIQTINISATSFDGITRRIISITEPKNDPNSLWRLMYWEKVVKAISKDAVVLLFGHGFTFTDLEYNGKVGDLIKSPFIGFHNSFIYILYRIGLVGLFLILVLWAPVAKIFLTTNNKLIKIHGLSFLSILIFAGFNVVFENPYYGFYIWFNMGAIFAIHYKNIKLEL